MQVFETTTLSEIQKEAVRELWNDEYLAKLALHTSADLESYLGKLTNVCHVLLTGANGEILGWAFSFDRDGERWFAIILHKSQHRQGKGTELLDMLKAREEQLCGWVTDHNTYIKRDGSAYESPLSFYLKNGFTVLSNTRLETEKLSAVKIEWKK